MGEVITQTFPRLYGYDVKGKMKTWSVQAQDHGNFSIVEIVYGYNDGKMTTSKQRVDRGKNIGRANETTHFQQAVSEAKSKWKRKTEGGFTTDLPKEFQKINTSSKTIDGVGSGSGGSGGVDGVGSGSGGSGGGSGGGVGGPMLACDYHKFMKRLQYPVYVQPKLDGYRMIFDTTSKVCNSRQGKKFSAVESTTLYKELCSITEQIVLDGELYKHGGVFEHLGALRKKRLTPQDVAHLETVEYHIYDYIDTSKTYTERYQILQQFAKRYNFTRIRFVETHLVQSKADLDKFHEGFVNDGYEGSIVRTRSGKYRPRARSQDLLKYKDFEDAEFRIVDFTSEQDTATNQDLIVWICETGDHQKFNVRPKGTREERNMLFKRGREFIGQQLHVKYFELTDLKIPRFPTTKSESYTTYIRNTIE